MNERQSWGWPAGFFDRPLGRLLATGLMSMILSWASATQIFASATAPSGEQGSLHHKIRVTDQSSGSQIVARGGHLIADYEGFQLYDVPSVNAVGGGRAEVHDEYNSLLLNSGRLETTSAANTLRHSAGSFTGKRLHLVQFAGPAQPVWRQELETAGVQVVAYVPQNGYLLYGDSHSIATVQRLAATTSHIQWEGPYLDAYKLHPAASPVDSRGVTRQVGTKQFAIQLLADPLVNAETLKLLDRLKLSPFKQHRPVLNYLNVVVELNAHDLQLVAARPDVISIQPYFSRQKFCERQDQIAAGALTGGVPTGSGYLAWLATKGFTQAQFTNSGFVVDVSDSGIDQGTTSPNHFGLYVGGVTANASRVAYARLEGTPNMPSTLQGCDGHGTLNAFLIGGYDNQTGFPHTDGSGYHYGLGICPFAALGSSVIFDPTNYTFPDFNDLQSDAYQSGARISNNSWGANVSGLYDIDAQNFDALVRDAQPTNSPYPTPGNQEMVVVVAAGNRGPFSQTIASPATAKNVLTVGAGENVQPFGGPDAGGIDDSGADDANDIISFSSRGPCFDGRHKPELVAPGTHVSGGLIQAAYPGPDGTADPCYTGSGITGGPITNGGTLNPFFPSGQQFFTASSGTSESAPCVSGACALLRQFFINKFTNAPSPAMTKAWLMNSARYMTGTNANDTLWSDSQGMGEVDLGSAFDGVARMIRDEVPADLFTASGQTRTFTGRICDTNRPFRVTLAWTDAPGSTTGAAYNNDLDLLVEAGGVLYKGNVFNGAWSTNGGSSDYANNAESVFLPPGTTGKFVVRLLAANINSDGVPGNAYPMDQDFALVIYNAVPSPAPFIEAAGTVLVGESCQPTNDVVDPGETVTLNFALQNTGTGSTTNLVATLLASNQVSAPSSPQSYGALVPGGPAVSLPFTFTAFGPCGGSITATLQLSDGAANLGTVSFTLPLGKLSIPLNQNFDAVTAPALPAGWTTSETNGGNDWITSSNLVDTPPNAAFVAEPHHAATLSDLVSPVIPIHSPSAQLTFQNQYIAETDPSNSSEAYEGGVLEIQIGTNAFTDIVTAGGVFLNGGYTRMIDPACDNPLAGREAWSGTNGPFAPTVINLPAATAGQNIQLRWRFGTDSTNSVGPGGWYIDTVSINEGILCCSMPPVFTSQPTNQFVLVGTNVAFHGAATGTPPLNYQWLFNGAGFDSATNNLLTLTNVQPDQMGGYSLVVTNSGGSLTSQVATLTVLVPPLINTINLTDSNVSITFPSVFGLSYVLEYKDNLNAPQWLPLPPAQAGTGSLLSLVDTNAPTASRFYRIRCY